MRGLLLLVAVAACAARSSARAPVESEKPSVSWADVRAAFDGLVCVESFPDGQGGVRELPMAGTRELCKLPPPSTALERATTRAFVEANDVIRAWPDEHRSAQGAVAAAKDHEEKLAAARTAIFSERVLAVLSRRIGPALADEGLRCSDCPTPPAMTPRTVAYAQLATYLAAYVWPDPVVTPHGAEPTYSMHMCVGINGIQRMPEVDEDVRFAALLAAFATEALFERAPIIFAEVRDAPEYAALTDDEAKTEYLRTHVGPRVAADPAVRAGICASLQRFASDTPIRVAECSQ